MKIRRIFFLLNSIWELVRFVLLFLAVWITFQQVLKTDGQAIFWLMLFGNGGLLVAAALLFLYVDPPRFRALLNLARLGKGLGLFSALLLIILEPFGTGLHSLSLRFPPYRIAPFSILLLIVVADLIFLFLLFSYQIEESNPTSPTEAANKEDPPLPEYRETVVPKSSD
jgi:hypothetical protein